MGREVGDRFFGGFWCSAILLKHQATIADCLAQNPQRHSLSIAKGCAKMKRLSMLRNAPRQI